MNQHVEEKGEEAIIEKDDWKGGEQDFLQASRFPSGINIPQARQILLEMTAFYFWMCGTFRALLLLSDVMIQPSSVSPQAPVNTDSDTLEEEKQ